MTTVTADLVSIPAGSFCMGAADAPHPEDGEGPAREVFLDGYRIGAGAVSVAEFAAFVAATGHVTQAEQRGSSHVFYHHLAEPDAHPTPFAATPWWRDVAGASWRLPNGASPALPDHPVVHVALSDAQAYCAWAGVRLPTEAEWERAAQGAESGAINIWRGHFPDQPEGQPGTLPVRSGAPNRSGLHHACGNVWEWTADGFGRLHSPRPARNPSGNLAAAQVVVKGGSYLCAPSYCARFRPSSRRAEHREATTGHTGFRVAS